MKTESLRKIIRAADAGKLRRSLKESAKSATGLSASAVLRCIQAAREQGLVIEVDQVWRIRDIGPFGGLRGKK